MTPDDSNATHPPLSPHPHSVGNVNSMQQSPQMAPQSPTTVKARLQCYACNRLLEYDAGAQYVQVLIFFRYTLSLIFLQRVMLFSFIAQLHLALCLCRISVLQLQHHERRTSEHASRRPGTFSASFRRFLTWPLCRC